MTPELPRQVQPCFIIRELILKKVLRQLPKVLSIRSGGEIRIKGATKKIEIVEGERQWNEIPLKEFQSRLSDMNLYFFTEKEVWQVTFVDKELPRCVGAPIQFEEFKKDVPSV